MGVLTEVCDRDLTRFDQYLIMAGPAGWLVWWAVRGGTSCSTKGGGGKALFRWCTTSPSLYALGADGLMICWGMHGSCACGVAGLI